MAMNAPRLVRLQQALECVGQDAEGFLIPLPCADPDEVPRLFVARHPGGYVVDFRHDVPRAVRQRLAVLDPEVALGSPATVQQVLAEAAPSGEVFLGKSYAITQAFTRADYPDVVPWSEVHQGFRGEFQTGGPSTQVIVVDGQLASACESSRENGDAGEAWVQTATAFRRRGYARQVVAAWAHSLQQRGKVPFYSHRLENQGSEAVARSLGLVPFITFAVYS